MKEYLVVFFRIITIMSLVLFVNLVLTGKRLVGEMPIFDFLIMITMGSVVGADIAEPDINHLPTAFAIVMLGLFQYGVNRLEMRYRRFSRVISFEPTVVMENGNFLVENMKKIRYSLEDVLMLLRDKGVFFPHEVHLAIVESNGKLTVLKKAEYQPLTPEDAQVTVTPKEIPVVAIIEGKIDTPSLQVAGVSQQQILNLLRKQGYQSPKEVFFATYDRQAGLKVYPYGQKPQINVQH